MIKKSISNKERIERITDSITTKNKYVCNNMIIKCVNKYYSERNLSIYIYCVSDKCDFWKKKCEKVVQIFYFVHYYWRI